MAVTKQLLEEINRAFETSNYSYLEAHITDDVRWTIGTRIQVKGKKEFIEVCRSAPIVDPKFLITNMIVEGDRAAVESIMVAKTPEGKQYQQAVCDIYHFVGDKFDQLTSYLDTEYDKEQMGDKSVAA